jgi:serine/threonine protein kinase
MAQITLGIMIMHSKKILHRDIKTQNMFLVGEVNLFNGLSKIRKV